MLVLIEGVDCTGKSTLAAALAESMGDSCETRHYSAPTRSSGIGEYTDDLQDYVPGKDQHTVCDRYHWGELVYGPMYRGESILKNDGWTYVEQFLRLRGAVMVYLWNTRLELEHRHQELGESFLELEHIGQVQGEYEYLVRHTTLPTLEYRDPTRKNVKEILQVASVFERNAALGWGRRR